MKEEICFASPYVQSIRIKNQKLILWIYTAKLRCGTILVKVQVLYRYLNVLTMG